MVFSSLIFLFFFLPITLLIYTISPIKYKNIILLIVSLIFYAWGEPVYIILMIISAVTDYFHGLLIDKFHQNNENIKAKMALISSLIINIGLLSFFKYADFLIHNINFLLNTTIDTLNLPLPIGISFYTFQTMSYTIDVYRKRVKPQKNPIALAMYVCLFPQLIAGPIVRYESIENELQNRQITFHHFSDGVKLFTIGLGKKVLLANNIGLLWDHIQQQGFSDLSILSAWLGIFAFAFQIYFDFSGYSDMAIGLGKMFGFTFPKNFNYPFISKNITEFWRRWHMSLGTWFRDYVYIPLGGNRVTKIRHLINIFIVWSLTGIWHGASWNFFIWGCYFAIMLIIEKAFLLKLLNKLHPIFHHIYFVFFISISWVFFLFENLSDGLLYFQIMFGFSKNSLINTQFLYFFYTNFILLIIVLISSTPFIYKSYNKFKNIKLFQYTIVLLSYITILILSTAYLVDEAFNPFLYFRF